MNWRDEKMIKLMQMPANMNPKCVAVDKGLHWTFTVSHQYGVLMVFVLNQGHDKCQ